MLQALSHPTAAPAFRAPVTQRRRAGAFFRKVGSPVGCRASRDRRASHPRPLHLPLCSARRAAARAGIREHRGKRFKRSSGRAPAWQALPLPACCRHAAATAAAGRVWGPKPLEACATPSTPPSLCCTLRHRRVCATQAQEVKYEHILLAILDSNPVLSSASRNAVQTAATLATQNSSKL